MVLYSRLERGMDTRDHLKNRKDLLNKGNFRPAQTFSNYSILCKLVFLLSLFCYLTTSVLAQDTPDSKETKSFPAQFSIYYPFATHGARSTDYTYNFSPNLVYGKIGGLNGIEISGTTVGVGVSLGLSLK